MAVNTENWFDILSGKVNLSQALSQGLIETAEQDRVTRFFSCFDLDALCN